MRDSSGLLNWALIGVLCGAACSEDSEPGTTLPGAGGNDAGVDSSFDSSIATGGGGGKGGAGAQDSGPGGTSGQGGKAGTGTGGVAGTGTGGIAVEAGAEAEAGPSCETACGASEACVLGHCGPIAFVLVGADATQPPFYCPPGYQQAGYWHTGPGVTDGHAEGSDLQGYMIDNGWAWICSAQPTRVGATVKSDDCGVTPAGACAGATRGSWHVGGGCGGSVSASDRSGQALSSGWLTLCVEQGVEARVETGSGDCGASGPGCGASRVVGAWHTMPAVCGKGNAGIGDSNIALESGWLALCLGSWTPLRVDTSTIEGKVMVGYQGWFGAEGEGSVRNAWRHWAPGVTPAAGNVTFDLWPDLSEYEPEELFATSLQYPGGAVASLYSAYQAKTVTRHFRWMSEYGIDGAFLQRFLVETTSPADLEFRDKVTQHALAAAQAQGRALAVMYDISGYDEATLVSGLLADWKHLIDDLSLTGTDRYLHYKGLPLVALWGLGFTDRPGTLADALAILDFFKNAPEEKYRAKVLGGVPTHWRTGTGDSKAGWESFYQGLDVLSPWSVGRYGDEAGILDFNAKQIAPDLSETNAQGIGYLPVVWPGFSWANLKHDPGIYNSIPRNGGRFFWKQIYEAQKSGASMLYVAMFDEVDEGTAIFKAAATQNEVPSTGLFLSLDADGEAVPKDWYLRIAAAGSKALVGQDVLSAVLPLQ